MPASSPSATVRRTQWSLRAPEAVAFVFLVAVVVTLLAPVVFEGDVLLPVDLVGQTAPWRSTFDTEPPTPHNLVMSDTLWEAYPMAVRAQALWRSGLPLWDPTALIGMPGLATGKMYTNPVFLALATVASPARAMSWAAVIHLLIAALGMVVLLRELRVGMIAALIGALAFAFNGYVLVWLSLTYFVGTMVWTPWLFWTIERALRRNAPRWLVVGAGVFAIQILAGYVLFAAHVGLLVAIIYGLRAVATAWRRQSWRAGRRPALYGAVAVAGGVALAAFQFLPAVELFRHADRARRAFESSMPLHEMMRLLAPGISGTPIAGGAYTGSMNYAETALYFGVVPLLCLIAALASGRRSALIFAGVGLMFWLAVFGVTPFHGLVNAITPGFRATFPGRVFFLVAFSWSVAAGFGADAILSRTPRPRLEATWVAIATAALFHLAFRSTDARWQRAGAVFEHPEAVQTASLWLVAAIVILGLRLIRPVPPTIVGCLLVALTLGDLVHAHGQWNATFPDQTVLPSTPHLARLVGNDASSQHTVTPHTVPQNTVPQNTVPPLRVATIDPSAVLPGMAAQAFGLSNVSGYSSWILERYSRYAHLTGTRYNPNHVNRVLLSACCGRLLDALAVEWVYAAAPFPRLDIEGSLLTHVRMARHQGERPPSVNMPRLRGGRREALLLHAPSRLVFPVERPNPIQLTAALGLDWKQCPGTDGVEFEVRVRTADGRSHVRFERHLTPRKRSRPAWVPIEVPLQLPQGGAITHVVLSANPGPHGATNCDWAQWAEPRLHYAEPPPVGLQRVARGSDPIYRNREAGPRAWLVHNVESMASDDFDAVEAWLRDPNHDLTRAAVVEGRPTLAFGPASPEDQARIVTFTSGRIHVETRTAAPALLVLAESYHPGWLAKVDGVRTPVYPANLTLRGIPVPAGTRQVTLTFRPTSFLVGIAISVATLLGLAAILYATRTRARR